MLKIFTLVLTFIIILNQLTLAESASSMTHSKKATPNTKQKNSAPPTKNKDATLHSNKNTAPLPNNNPSAKYTETYDDDKNDDLTFDDEIKKDPLILPNDRNTDASAPNTLSENAQQNGR